MDIVLIFLCIFSIYLLVRVHKLENRIEEAEEDLKVIRGIRILSEMISSASKEKGEDNGTDNSSGL